MPRAPFGRQFHPGLCIKAPRKSGFFHKEFKDFGRNERVKDWKFHCNILRVSENASNGEIKRSYRKLALERHPDKHNGSTRAKEEFQQLTESYQFLLDRLKNGPLPQPEMPRPSQEFTAPARQQPQEPAKRKGFAKICMHAGAACAFLLLVSFWLDQPSSQNREPLSIERDLSLKAWCYVSYPEKNGSHDISEFSSQNACTERCATMAAGQNVSCTWNGIELHAWKPDTKPRPGKIAIPCEISVGKTAEEAVSANYNQQTEESCRLICIEKMGSLPRAAIRCSWGGAQFLGQQAARPSAPEQKIAPISIAPPAVANGDGPRSICYMTVVSPGNPLADAIPNETEQSCAERCTREIIAHPLDRIVKCAFAGRELINHTPDPMASFMARTPSESGFRQGDTFLANCEIYGTLNEKRIKARAGLTTEEECSSYCKREFKLQAKDTELTCTYNGQGFFQETAQ